MNDELHALVASAEPAARSLMVTDEHAARTALTNDESEDRDAAGKAAAAAERDLVDAAAGYNAEYRERMMAKALPDFNVPPPRPFIGFSLAEDVKRGILVVDGLYKGGPAYQTGIRIGDILLRVCGVAVNTIAEARRVVDARCRCGRVAPFTLVTQMNQQYSVALWIMTADPQHSEKPFFFDVHLHDRLESPRKKNIVESMDVLRTPAVSADNTPRTSPARETTPRSRQELYVSPASSFAAVTPQRPTMPAPRSSHRRGNDDSGGFDDDVRSAATATGSNGLSPGRGESKPRHRMLQN
ncbi:putative viscerotropic leishmaniasis antigen [Leptomonas pyrrhocoris]|uniref:Putative viscerotropic leishmaniasis antigen n=1 Tax=Leptomonas pyrrhocoris TaxID=157538 RepID=A0A0M9G233_LEPPY|nr:putative viscerotropic leishmaniasis antigen [Leptomonas pyrrhocoris]KPA80775.1 putative viscerotropic leishmaniasis antigen [Leptomonas pyrrhocoris]|eukprot:XP_015659214.1 putative viscerotropic leishmaniasis antigen [Leptomonas pyrrhocoris]